MKIIDIYDELLIFQTKLIFTLKQEINSQYVNSLKFMALLKERFI